MSPHERLTTAISRIPASVDELRAVLRFINDAPNIEPLLDAMVDLSRSHGNEPQSGLADEFAILRSDLSQVVIDPEQHDLAGERWKALRAGRGNLYADLDEVLAAASAIGIRPDEPGLRSPESETVSRRSQEGRLAALESRLRAVAEMMDDTVVPEGLPGAGRGGAQLVQVHQYVTLMRRNIRLFNLTLNIGDLVDLAALERAVTAIGRITRGFHATVVSAASRATQALRAAMGGIRRPVRRLATGVGTVIKATIRADRKLFATDDDGGSPPFDLEAARSMILRGLAPPPAWVPEIVDLNFSGSNLQDLTPLAGLTFLRQLNASGTRVSEVDSLKGLHSLRQLNLANTAVTDLEPLSALRRLENLNLWGSDITDIGPLAGLTNLVKLDIWETNVSDISALADMRALEKLDIWATDVFDLSPLRQVTSLTELCLGDGQGDDLSVIAALTNLSNLSLIGMKVRSIAPLRHLTRLETLSLAFTNVSDLSPLAELKALRIIDLKNNEVADLSPLNSLPALKHVYVESESRKKALARSFNRPKLLVIPEK
ncbi:MAG TPA: leucine-rich repeat domain-containing protein [Allosphingosinicella sp.]|nr:leucine-rich repeat domain-containing protein [Allosphingosinicella sp.]